MGQSYTATLRADTEPVSLDRLHWTGGVAFGGGYAEFALLATPPRAPLGGGFLRAEDAHLVPAVESGDYAVRETATERLVKVPLEPLAGEAAMPRVLILVGLRLLL